MVTIQVWSQGRSCHFHDIDNNTRSNTNRMSQHFLLFSFIECSSFSNSSYNWLAQCLLVLFFSLLCQLFLLFVVIEDGWHVLSWVACCGVMVVPKHLEHFTIWRYCGIILYVNCLSMVPSVTAQQKLQYWYSYRPHVIRPTLDTKLLQSLRYLQGVISWSTLLAACEADSSADNSRGTAKLCLGKPKSA